MIIMKEIQNEQIKYPNPDSVFLEKPSIRKYIKYLSFFGPGAIVASLTIGQGQLIIGPQIGAWAGFALLWLITLNIGSYIIAYFSLRFTMLSGITVIDLFAEKTKKSWFNWLIIIIMLIFIPIFTASIITTLGQSIQWILGFGHYLIWGVLFCLIAGIIVLMGRYRLLEYTQSFFVGILAIGAIISILYIKPDLLEIIPNYFLIGNVPNVYPAWVEQVEGFSKTPIPLVMLGYLGTLSFTLITLIGYLGWIKVKKWGIFKDQINPNHFSENLFGSFKKYGKIKYLPDDKNEIKKSKILLKPLIIDLSIAFIVVTIVSSAYMIAGKYLLGPETGLPTDVDLIKTQGIIFYNIANWLEPLFKISVFFALFGTVYAGFEAATRMLYETGKSLHVKIKKMEYKKFMLFFMIYILALGIPLSYLMFLGLSVFLMLSITLLFIGVVGVIIYGIGALYLSQKVLPQKYKLGKKSLFLSILAIILFLIPFIFLFL